MDKLCAAFLVGALMPATAILRGASQNIEMNIAISVMHPAEVGKLLHQVELRWEETRLSALQNQIDEKVGVEDMVKSCSKVAMAIIEGSEGDKDKVVEYMQDVCSSTSDVDQTEKCQQFSKGIEGAMSDDMEVNRNELDLSKFCQAFWSGPVTDVAQKQAQKEEEEAAAKANREAKAALKETEIEQAQASSEAVGLDEQLKGLEASMTADDEAATKLLDRARQEDQLAEEREEADATKVLEEADASESVDQNATAAAQDDAEAIAAGDEAAEKIADKALKKAALVVAKKNTTIAEPKKNSTVVEPKNNTTMATKKVEAKNATKEVMKKF